MNASFCKAVDQADRSVRHISPAVPSTSCGPFFGKPSLPRWSLHGDWQDHKELEKGNGQDGSCVWNDKAAVEALMWRCCIVFGMQVAGSCCRTLVKERCLDSFKTPIALTPYVTTHLANIAMHDRRGVFRTGGKRLRC